MLGLSTLCGLIVALSSCVHVRLDAANLLSPDQGPGTARLDPKYQVEQAVIVEDGRAIGITHAHRPGNRVVILFCGGDSFRRSQHGGTVLQALAVGADVVLFDYPGFGESTGAPTPKNLVDAGQAAHRFIVSLPSTRQQHIVIYGFSLGGMVAAQLARRVAADAVVLESTASNVSSWADTQVPWYLAPFVRLDIDPSLAQIDSVEALRAYSGRVLLLAGLRDRKTPPSLSRDARKRLLAVGVNVSLIEVAGAGHGEIYRSTEFRPALEHFLAQL